VENLGESTLSSFMKIGSRPVYIASVMAGKGEFRCVTITSLLSTQVSPAPEEVLMIIRENSRFLTAVKKSQKFCVNLMPINSRQDAVKYAQAGRDDDKTIENLSWDCSSGIPIFKKAHSYLLLSVTETVSRINNVLVYSSVEHVSVSNGNSSPLQYGFGKFQPESGK